eukprot:gene6911-biopygen22468
MSVPRQRTSFLQPFPVAVTFAFLPVPLAAVSLVSVLSYCGTALANCAVEWARPRAGGGAGGVVPPLLFPSDRTIGCGKRLSYRDANRRARTPGAQTTRMDTGSSPTAAFQRRESLASIPAILGARLAETRARLFDPVIAVVSFGGA